MQDIHDIRPPVMVGMDPFFLRAVLMVLALVLLGGVAFLVYRYLRQRQQGADSNLLMLPMPLAPRAAAMNALSRLEDSMESNPRDYYFRLTEIIKRFMGRHFNIKAPEMTTQELIAVLRDLKLDRELFSEIRDFMLFSDMIKYAGQAPSFSMMNKHLALARTFVTRTGNDDGDKTVEAENV